MKIQTVFLTSICTGLTGCAIDLAQAQDFYVSDFNNGGVGVVNVFQPGNTGTSTAIYDNNEANSQGVAFDGSGNLYVSYNQSGNINTYSPSGVYLSTFAGGGGGGAIAFNSAGDLFASQGNQVSEYDASGNSLGAFASVNNNAQGLAFGSSGNLYVADGGNNSVDEFSAGGSLLQTFTTGLNNPFGVAINGAGDLFVANYGSGTISEFAANGTSLGNFAAGLNSPCGLAFEGNGDLLEADHGSGVINEIDSSGNIVDTYSSSTVAQPQYITVEPTPEPATWAMLGMGAVGGLMRLRRKA